MDIKYLSEFNSIYYSIKSKKNSINSNFYILSEALFKYCINIWDSCEDKFNLKPEVVIPYQIKLSNNNATDVMFRKIGKILDAFHNENDNMLKKKIYSVISEFCSTTGFFVEKLTSQYPTDYIESTKDFIQKSVEFDKRLLSEEIVQALRNVWTTNLLQSMFMEPVCISPSIFGYSLLYPYTDNMLDNESTKIDDKIGFVNRIAYKLSGKSPIAIDSLEEKVFLLIENIKNQYSISQNDLLYKCLKSINRYQFDSTKLSDKNKVPKLEKLLSITFEKGGMSVLTDGFLINENITMEKLLLSYVIGVLLQLMDDFQDVITDKNCCQSTIFTEALKNKNMEPVTNKLFNFVDVVGEFILKFSTSPTKQDLRNAMVHYSRILIYFSINRNRKYFSRNYLKKINQYYPYTSSYMDGFNKKLKKIMLKFKDLNINFNELLDIIA